MSYKIVIADYYYPNNDQEMEILSALEDVEILDLTKVQDGGIKDAGSLIPYVKDADALIVQFADVNKDVIAAMENCKIIARYAIGVDNIDIEAATGKGIVVSNVPDYCIEEVSDTAMAHIMNCLRSVATANLLIHEDRWEYDKIKPLKRVAENTIGLIAFGHIARRTADKLKPYGVKVLAYDPFYTDDGSYDWVEFVSLEDLYKRSDLISVHAPLNDATRHTLNDEAFAMMQDGVYVVNTSRGGLIDEKALVRALESGKLRAASLDVLDMLDSDYNQSELLKYPEQITITPHLSWYSETSISELQRKVAMNVFKRLKEGKPLYQVN